MPYSAQKDKEFPRLLCTCSNLLLFRAQRNGRVPHGSTPHSGRDTVLLHPSEHRYPILSTLSEPLSKQLVSVLGPPPARGPYNPASADSRSPGRQAVRSTPVPECCRSPVDVGLVRPAWPARPAPAPAAPACAR